MNKTLAISAIALIAVIMVVGTVSPTVFAEKPDKEKKNNGGNGCEKSGNAKACENNPNSTPIPTCEECVAELLDAYAACGADYECQVEAAYVYIDCIAQVPVEDRTCSAPPPPGF